jgi:hypothetical protein
MAKTYISIAELVGKIARKELRLPEMQRRYEWRSTQVRDLLDSLYRGYPTGSILAWETDKPVSEREFAVKQQEGATRNTLLLLDGQQRLTSLYALLRGVPVRVRGKAKPIDILFNLDHPDQRAEEEEPDLEEEEEEDEEDDASEEGAADRALDPSTQFERMTFVVSSAEIASRPNWVPVTRALAGGNDADILRRAGVQSFDDPRFRKYQSRLTALQRIREYQYHVEILEPTLAYREVAEVFVRVNSSGTKLRGSDLALALITAQWPGSLSKFQEFEEQCARSGFAVDIGLLVRSLVAVATGQSRFQVVRSLSRSDLERSWELTKKAVQAAVDTVRFDAGIDSPSLLSSGYVLVAMAYLHHKHPHLNPGELRRWILLASAKGRYSGSSETRLDQDLRAAEGASPLPAMLELLQDHRGSLPFSADDLRNKTKDSPLFTAMFLAFRAAGATDWRTGEKVAIETFLKSRKLEFHHIFPKALLERSERAKKEINDIANLCFITSSTNKWISDRPPDVYFPLLREQSPGCNPNFAAQAVPTLPELLSVKNYQAFLEERREQIATALNTFVAGGRALGAAADS